MGKAAAPKRNGTKRGSPYEIAPSVQRQKNNIFKLNKDLGQHVLKNPGIAQAIVDKADLKQSDVREAGMDKLIRRLLATNFCIGSLRSWSRLRESDRQNPRESKTSYSGGNGPSNGSRGHQTSTRKTRGEEVKFDAWGCHQDGATIF